MSNCNTLLILKARAELEYRKRLQNKKNNDLNFSKWLHEISPTYNWNWPYLKYSIEILEKIFLGHLKRVIVMMPPRHGKSQLFTVRYPAYLLEQCPEKRIITGSYNQTLADKFSRQTRKIVMSRMNIDRERRAVSDWRTNIGEGGLRAVGVGGGITGQGGDLIILDDPIKSREEADSQIYRDRTWDWYTDDIYSRLEPNGSIVLIMTRWHTDDLAGRILQSDDAINWTVINFPALAENNDLLGRVSGEALCPDRFNTEQLLEIKAVMGASFQALYQQRPTAIEGAIFKREYWQYYKECPEFNLRVLSIDTAFKTKKENDFSVINFYGKTNTASYMVNRWKGKVEYPDLKRAVIECATNFQPHEILIEDKASGQSLIQELRRGTNLPIKAIQVDSDKIARANASVGFIEAGKLLLPMSAPWLLDYLDTMAAFPNFTHDDDVDATTQYLSRHGFKTMNEFRVY